MRDLLLNHIVYPAMWFVFEFIGDRPWLAAIIVGLIALLIWRFLWPVVTTFHTLFGWKGWALLGAALVTFGAYGAGWRAHRDAVYPVGKDDDKTDKPVKPKKPKKDKGDDPVVIFPDGDDWLKRIFNRT
jgi:hypothetical protein